jgi:crotonobetainyl-CoA:carnitine CoA-transferase CaiB-like acyl-CoA transferase
VRGRPDDKVVRPLEGLRVLDLGVIVFGAEAGRLFADQGADVVKIENSRFPDGARQSFGAGQMGIGFAYGHRNKRGLAVDLRNDAGAALFRRLVSQADVVLSNFKPGTLESLGLGYDEMARVNPAVVVAESSAFGPSGPWSHRMGYGPLVRACTGLTSMWRYPDGAFADAMTVYPDHAAARVVAMATLALVLRRRRTGRGGLVTVSQAETVLMQMAGSAVSGSDVYPCAGDDEWVVVTLRDDEDRRRLEAVTGGLELEAWTELRSPREAMEVLQAAGIPAGAMLRVAELPDDPHLAAREFFATLEHPLLPESLTCERGPARFERIPDPELRAAPLYGEHTREVCREWLAMEDPEIDELLAAGVLDQTATQVPA